MEARRVRANRVNGASDAELRGRSHEPLGHRLIEVEPRGWSEAGVLCETASSVRTELVELEEVGGETLASVHVTSDLRRVSTYQPGAL